MKTNLTLLLALTSLLFFTGCRPAAPTPETVTEYRVDVVPFQHDPPNGLQDYLNKMSIDGWHLVQFVEHDEWYRVVMSRAKK